MVVNWVNLMKILLLQPNYDSHIIHPPLGLGYLAAYLKKNGHEVSIYDGTLKNANLEDFITEIKMFLPDLVGISILSRGYQEAKKLIKLIKNEFRDLPVVIGGTQVTAAPKEVLSDLKADFAVVGEGEITLLELVKNLKNSKKYQIIDGLAYWKEKNVVCLNKPRELIKNLDDIPFPAWNLMPPDKYRIVPILEPSKTFPIAPIMTSRGCPYNCSFCASNVTWKRKLRLRSVNNVLAEIELLKKEFGVKEIHFSDDNFTADVKRAEKICLEMIKRKINLPWQCPNGVRIDKLPVSLIKLMKKSGCYAVGLGIESGNQEMLRSVNKQLDLKIVPSSLKNLKKEGIESYGFFILGLPGETKKTAKETINFALNNSFDRVWFNIFTPYPGSDSFLNWLKDKKFSQIDWGTHDCSTAVIDTPGFTRQELETLQKISLLRFYLRPKVFFRTIAKIGPKEIMTFIKTRFFGNLFRQH